MFSFALFKIRQYVTLSLLLLVRLHMRRGHLLLVQLVVATTAVFHTKKKKTYSKTDLIIRGLYVDKHKQKHTHTHTLPLLIVNTSVCWSFLTTFSLVIFIITKSIKYTKSSIWSLYIKKKHLTLLIRIKNSIHSMIVSGNIYSNSA